MGPWLYTLVGGIFLYLMARTGRIDWWTVGQTDRQMIPISNTARRIKSCAGVRTRKLINLRIHRIQMLMTSIGYWANNNFVTLTRCQHHYGSHTTNTPSTDWYRHGPQSSLRRISSCGVNMPVRNVKGAATVTVAECYAPPVRPRLMALYKMCFDWLMIWLKKKKTVGTKQVLVGGRCPVVEAHVTTTLMSERYYFYL